MKRALAVLLACCGFAAFGMFKGTWEASVCLVPNVTLSSTLTLTYSVAGFDITSTTTFGAAGITGQSFSLRGALGPLSLTGKMRFDPATPAYEVGQLATSLDFAGLGIGLTVNHWLDGEWDPVYFGYPTGTADPCPPQTGANLQYVLTAKLAPVDIQVRYLDCCAGTYFQDLLVSLTGVEFCCGIKYNASLNFTKEGFQSLAISGIGVPLCCGVSLDFGITYSVTGKSVTVTPKFAGFAEACFTVWGGPVSGTTSNIWEGLRIDGFRIRCTIVGCNYLEYVHAWNPTAGTIPAAIRGKFACGADEYLELGFCGPGCCGGNYSATLRILWDSTPTATTLFGLAAFIGSVEIPIMTGFSVNMSFRMPAASGLCDPSFCLGWKFTF